MKKRIRRFKVGNGVGCYHCMSRVVAAEKLMRDPEVRRMFRRMMLKMANFCGVRILTYAIMENHFHILVEIDESAEVSDGDILTRVEGLYGEEKRKNLEGILKGADEESADQLRTQYKARMNDLSVFLKELKQRFSIWFNRTHDRIGTLWAERFKSVLVQGGRQAMAAVAAYIDLNPVRAGLVEDPADYYPLCGYAAALRGKGVERDGLCRAMLNPDWRTAQPEYRAILYGKGIRGKNKGSGQVLDAKKFMRLRFPKDQNAPGQVFRHHTGLFSGAKAIGDAGFVEYFHHLAQTEAGVLHPHKMAHLPEEMGEICLLARPRKAGKEDI